MPLLYQWDFFWLKTSNEYSTYFEFDEAGFYDVTLQVWNYLGCLNTTQTIEISLEFDLYSQCFHPMAMN
ncbi:MAG: hypothetical protein LC127_07155 [Chitinophagales bacterium]|nr:hypothetical protein [Chitinophagales bacterium]